MGSYSVKRIDEMEAIFHGSFRRAGAELGLESFGLQVFDMPAGYEGYPEHAHDEDGQEEVYVVLKGSGEFDIEGELLVLCDLGEGAVDVIAQGREGGFADVERDGARFDLGQIQNVVDEAEKVGTRMMDRTGEFDLLVGQVALCVFRQKLREDQETVQRRAQLVAHIGQEFGLVL